MTDRELYLTQLVKIMRHQGRNKWGYGEMADLCDMANIWDKWLRAETDEENHAVTLEAARILNVIV